MKKLAEKISSGKTSLAQTILLLKERFERIVGHISDFAFVADTVRRTEHFKLYTQRVFLLALTLREAGEHLRKLHQEDSAIAKFRASSAIVDELLHELRLAKMVREGIDRTS